MVNNIPCVGADKVDKLTAILRKKFGLHGAIRDGGFSLPVDPATGLTKGYAFVEYETVEQARAACADLDGYALDKSHTFAATLFDEVVRLGRVPEAYAPPVPKPAEPVGDLLSWLSDPRGRDQFVARYADETEICWNDAARQLAEEVYKRPFWTEAPFVVWSPQGALVATLHRQGVAVWGGPEFRRVARFSQAEVQRLAFSPCETYVAAYSEVAPAGPRGAAGFILNVFEVRTGRKLRTFEGPQADFAVGAALRQDGGLAWPAFKWSGGDSPGAPRFLAHLKPNAISVYASPDMAMLDKRSIKAEGVVAFEWSPGDAVLCAYQEEQGNLPARVVLVSLPSREEVRAKNLFSVADVKMAWHPQGDYLAVRVEKWTKTRKSTTTNLELFSLRERNVPVDMLELPNKAEKVMAVAWEPRGHRFAALHGGADGRPSVSIYSMRDPKSGAATGVHLLHHLPNKQASSLHWSPAGRFLLLAGLGGGHNGKLEWWDADEGAIMAAGEHFMATELEWDPTGRFVATCVTAVNSMENGYFVWSFSGQLLYK